MPNLAVFALSLNLICVYLCNVYVLLEQLPRNVADSCRAFGIVFLLISVHFRIVVGLFRN